MENYRFSLKEQNQECFLYIQNQDTGRMELFYIYEEKGRGASCIVYQAYLCKDGKMQRPVLLKEFYPIHLSRYLKRDETSHALCIAEEIREAFEEEKKAFLDMCQKQNQIYMQNAKNSADEMVEIQGIYTLGESFYVLMKAASGCSWDQMEKESLFQMLETTVSVLHELEEFHNIGWLHGDIKPANIYIFKKTRQHVCLLDFGSMHQLFDGALTGNETLAYSIQYAAPEVLEAEGTEGLDRMDYFSCITTKADLYSVAAVLYGKITGEYKDADLPDKVFQKQLDEKLTELWETQKHLWLKNVPATVLAELKVFFSVMLSVNPNKRYTLPEMVQKLSRILSHAEPVKLKLSPKCKPIHPTENFIGRKQELEILEQLLKQKNQTIYILGDGGLGKSELALELAWRLKEDFDFYWVSFSGDLEQTILSIQTEPPCFHRDDWDFGENAKYQGNQKVDKRDLYRWNLKCLQGYGSTSVLIIDNFDVTLGQKYEILHSTAYADLMQLEMKVIFTSREYLIEQEADVCVSLKEMADTELLDLMCMYYKGAREEENMYQLIHMVDNNTLLVKQIGNVLEQSWGELTPQKLVDSFYNTDSDGGGKKLYRYTRKLFNLSVLDEKSKYVMAQTILFPTEGVRADMYLRCHDEWERDKIRLLELGGWIKKTSNNLLLVHSMIREVCKKELPQKEESCAKFLEAYYAQYEKLSPKDWMEQRFQRMEIALHAADNLADESGAYAKKAGDMSYQEGRYVQALEYYQSFWTHFINTYENPDTLEAMEAMDRIANSAYAAGDLESAIYYESSGVRIAGKQLGKYCAELFPYYVNMANIYKDYRAYEDAEKYYAMALEIYEKHGMTNMFQKAVLYMNYAKLCEKKGAYEHSYNFAVEAMELFRQLKNIPPIYPASIFVTFGILCYHYGIYEEALMHYEQAIEIYETVLGKEHPTVAGCYNNKGISLTMLRRYDEAFACLETARKIQEEVLGMMNASTANTYHSIAMLYYAKKQYLTAQFWCNKAKEIREKLYGVNSPITNKSILLYEEIVKKMKTE